MRSKIVDGFHQFRFEADSNTSISHPNSYCGYSSYNPIYNASDQQPRCHDPRPTLNVIGSREQPSVILHFERIGRTQTKCSCPNYL
ncbi:hypothetical protein HanPSC8_Chr13g0587491 [Helianthus annuus]|nr:hypothetical protein HanPSC8_Chr13g0587491 [Helianthus annuus]